MEKEMQFSYLVTIGEQELMETQKPFEAGDLTRYLYLHGLSLETAESLAEYAHTQARLPPGIGVAHFACVTDLFHQKYRGSRYSFGYPPCPKLEGQANISKLLEPEKSIGVRLTKAYHLEPDQSSNTILVHHPRANCFLHDDLKPGGSCVRKGRQ